MHIKATCAFKQSSAYMMSLLPWYLTFLSYELTVTSSSVRSGKPSKERA